MHRFFAYNPVFAWVIALFIALFGVMALKQLPIEQYPNVAPPSLTLSMNYAGADARTMDRNVTSIIEKELNGVDNFLYMAATSRSNGTAQIVVTFQPGTDIDIARTQVQDRLSRVEPRLPQEVRQLGIQVTKSSSGFLMIAALQSKTGATSAVELGNLASTRIIDELRRVPGVGDVTLFGSQYAMRVWLDQEKLAGYGLSPTDALAAVKEQNSQTAGGGIGQQPITRESEFAALIQTQNRFTTPEQFRQIILRSFPDGSTIRLGDVARVELGQESYAIKSNLNGRDMAGMAIQLAGGANALATKEAVVARLDELSKSLPADVEWSAPFDTTPFVTASIESVVHTLVEAMVLVFLVMFLFLQNWRATLIPALVVPIALAGSCLGLWLFGMSINTLTLFAMVVAIGILVDDAIVVVENVERIMAQEGLNARRATVKAMSQITGAIIGITLVLCAVFIPMAFFPGSTGIIYRQFSVTLAISIFVSAVLALTLTPALTASLLKPHAKQGEHQPRPGVGGLPQRFFNGFNRMFARGTDRYVGAVGAMTARPLRWLIVFLVMCGVTLVAFTRLPGGFLPEEDQGYVFVALEGPPGSTQQRTEQQVRAVEGFLRKQPEVRNVVSVVGFSLFSQGQGAGMAFVDMHPWEERAGKEHSSQALVGRINAFASQLPGAVAFAINPPPITALGNASGFTMKLEDRSGEGGEALLRARDQILAAAATNPALVGVRPEGSPPGPQLFVDIDRIRARALGLQIADINNTLSIAFASAYANDFSREGAVLRVYLQAEASQRMTPQDVLSLRVKNSAGEMVPFSAFTTVKWAQGAQQLDRYNGYPAVTISGMAAPGHASGEGLEAMEAIAAKVIGNSSLAIEWTGVAYQEKAAGNQVALLLGLSLVIVYLLLAALYRSWPIPVAVLLVVPFGVLGSVLFAMLRGFSADVYFTVGLITIIGLAAKNAILIVEFAIDDERRGASTAEAALEASRQRLRPILMTSLAFILGMVPLVLASGASAASRQAVGTGVAGGVLVATMFGIFYTPVFYVATKRWLSRTKDYRSEDDREEREEAERLAAAGENSAHA